jgi:molecular chaperone GrpE
MRSSRVSDHDERAQGHQAPDAATGTAPPEPPSRPAAGDEHAAELARAEDRYKRALADLDNFRKRTVRETQRRVDEAGDAATRDWLEVVDSVERALRMESAGNGALAHGLKAVLQQMDAVLQRQGVSRIGAPGDAFDPERHEAISVSEAPDAPDRSVLDVARSGYERGGRILRPAQVVVARRPAEPVA